MPPRQVNVPEIVTGQHQRWSVMWLIRRKGKWVIFEKEFDHDFYEALRVYMLAKQAKKPFATLRSMNVAYPPPDKYTHAEGWKVVTHRGRRYKQRVTINRMSEVNLKGWWWCPYCREMRRFERRDGFRYDGIYVPREAMYCPICGISHENMHVRKYNPQAEREAYRPKRTRKGKDGKRRKRRRS